MPISLRSMQKNLLVPLSGVEHLYLLKLAESKNLSVTNLLRQAVGLTARPVGRPSGSERRTQTRRERELCVAMGIAPDEHCDPDPGEESQYIAQPARPRGRPRLPLPDPTPEQVARFDVAKSMNADAARQGLDLPRLPESLAEEREMRLAARRLRRQASTAFSGT